MRHTIWRLAGITGFWLTWPLIWIYLRVTPPRVRILIIHEQSVLVVKNWLGSSHWTLPGGGIHKSELPSESAIREVTEELGLVFKPAELIDLGRHSSLEKGGLRNDYYLFAVTLADRPPVTINNREIMGFDWLDMSKLADQKTLAVSLGDAAQTWNEYQKML